MPRLPPLLPESVSRLPRDLTCSVCFQINVRKRAPQPRHARLADGERALLILPLMTQVLRTFPRRDMPPADFYARLVAEIDAVGWAHLISMDDLLTSVQLRERDASGKKSPF